MTYTLQGDRVTIEMSCEDYERLMLMLGIACGVASRDHDKAQLYRCLEFVNELNTNNPNFTPYEIPKEYAAPR